MLLLGVSGLIILFWFLKGGEALRYLVSFFAHILTAPSRSTARSRVW